MFFEIGESAKSRGLERDAEVCREECYLPEAEVAFKAAAEDKERLYRFA